MPVPTTPHEESMKQKKATYNDMVWWWWYHSYDRKKIVVVLTLWYGTIPYLPYNTHTYFIVNPKSSVLWQQLFQDPNTVSHKQPSPHQLCSESCCQP